MNRKDRRKSIEHKKRAPEMKKVSDTSFIGKVKTFYEKKYKLLLILPIVLFIFSVGVIIFQVSTTGSFISKGISLSGGVSLNYNSVSKLPISEVENAIASEFPSYDFSVRTLQSELGFSTIVELSLDVQSSDFEEIRDRMNDLMQNFDSSAKLANTEIIGSVLGESFFKTAFRSVIIAFILMGVVVFIYFKNPSPSLAVIAAAVADILETVAIVNLLGIKVSTAGIAAFLMLIGYSVDTDILLTTRVLKNSVGTVMDRIYSSFKTGILMTITTLSALTVGLLLAKSEVLHQILLIVLIGLLLDIINTWIQNVAILRLYLERNKTPEKIESEENIMVSEV